jgi:cytochrome c oxidase subunit 2
MATAAFGREEREPRHFLRILITWVILSAILTPFVWFVLGPHLSPGTMSDSANGQQFDMKVLLSIATPVMLAVYVWFGYAMIFFRQKGPDIQDGLWVKRDSILIQVTWLAVTATLVVFLFGFGTYELVNGAGAGGGEGPSAIWSPKGVHTSAVWAPKADPAELEVQVIGQQWLWTFRWPQFGGMETNTLNLPVDTPVKFNVTSLDVIHSFWAFQLGVKADANPGVNDIAFTRTEHDGTFNIRCSELCGIWHADMVSTGHVMSQRAFYGWVTAEEKSQASQTKVLPPYSLAYSPSLNGAGGGLYDNSGLPGPTNP